MSYRNHKKAFDGHHNDQAWVIKTPYQFYYHDTLFLKIHWGKVNRTFAAVILMENG